MNRARFSQVCRRPHATFMCLLALVVLTAPALPAQQPDDLDDLANQVSAAIRKSSHRSPQPVDVLVVEFEGKSGAKSELGPELANEFTDSLRKQGNGLHLLTPSEIQQAVTKHNLPETAVLHPAVLQCYAPELGLAYVINGTMEYEPDGVVLHLAVRYADDLQSILAKTVVLPMTDEMRELAAKPVPVSPPFFTQEEMVWTNPNVPPLSDAQVADMKKGGTDYSYPQCLFCPHAEFSDKALRARIQGTVALLVQIPPAGVASKISLVRGLPCGLSEKALEAVVRWRFKPAIGHDGAPVAVNQAVEVTFHLY